MSREELAEALKPAKRSEKTTKRVTTEDYEETSLEVPRAGPVLNVPIANRLLNVPIAIDSVNINTLLVAASSRLISVCTREGFV